MVSPNQSVASARAASPTPSVASARSAAPASTQTQGSEDRLASVLPILIDHIAQFVEAPSDLRRPKLFNHLLLSLRVCSSEVQQQIYSKVASPLLPIVPSQSNTSPKSPLLSFKDFFEGPGLALKKLYQTLPRAQRQIFEDVLKNSDPGEVRALFSAKNYPNLSQSSTLRSASVPVEYSELSGQGREIYLNGTDTAALGFYSFTEKSNPNRRVHLLGSLNLNTLTPFEGLAHVWFSTVPRTNYFFPVRNKEFKPGDVFDGAFLLKDSKGVKIQSRNDGAKEAEWQNVTFQANGDLQAGCTGKKIMYKANGFKGEWQDVRFESNGDLQAGCTGTRVGCAPGGVKMEWPNVTFHANGTMQAGSTRTWIYYRADGTKEVEWQDVTIQANGHLKAGCTGTRISYRANGSKEFEWQNVTLQESGKVQAGCTGTKIWYQADGTKEVEWQDVTFQANGHLQAGCTGKRISYRANGSKEFEWQNLTFSERGGAREGSSLACVFYKEIDRSMLLYEIKNMPRFDESVVDNQTAALILKLNGEEVGRFAPVDDDAIQAENNGKRPAISGAEDSTSNNKRARSG